MFAFVCACLHAIVSLRVHGRMRNNATELAHTCCKADISSGEKLDGLVRGCAPSQLAFQEHAWARILFPQFLHEPAVQPVILKAERVERLERAFLMFLKPPCVYKERAFLMFLKPQCVYKEHGRSCAVCCSTL